MGVKTKHEVLGWEQMKHFNGADIFDEDAFWCAHPIGKLSKGQREKLKNIGWVLTRHTRTKKEIWVLKKGLEANNG